MQKLADISVFENLQATANQQMATRSPMSVFADNFGSQSEQPLERKYEGLSEAANRETSQKERTKLLAKAQDVNAELQKKIEEGVERNIQKQGEALGRIALGRDLDGNKMGYEDTFEDALTYGPPLWYGAKEKSKGHKKREIQE